MKKLKKQNLEYRKLKDFCKDQGEIQLICREFGCDENEIVLTPEQAFGLAQKDLKFKEAMRYMNKD